MQVFIVSFGFIAMLSVFGCDNIQKQNEQISASNR
jgi:hypothetical protein